MNPLYVYIACMRGAVMDGLLPTLVQWIQMILWGVGMFLVGAAVFRSQKNKIMQKL